MPRPDSAASKGFRQIPQLLAALDGLVPAQQIGNSREVV
jgi:hypothetical protein